MLGGFVLPSTRVFLGLICDWTERVRDSTHERIGHCATGIKKLDSTNEQRKERELERVESDSTRINNTDQSMQSQLQSHKRSAVPFFFSNLRGEKNQLHSSIVIGGRNSFLHFLIFHL